ncbi:outer membrane protein [Sandaracinobacteroides saxicola]|uniref:Porin family protein n=1 Tax=Sandaracinobacteroides saxicola TaxID=2759707 RepID=A0A7G5IGB3_9SPHN|nr:outer membrane protein [Sandaracinobacteroides saxicola]QMW22405.1 porin family protein [Sandaracinobacteroides saxicola]
MRKFSSLALLGLAVSAPAFAAEPFNGPYVGATLGWQQDRLNLSVTDGGVTQSASATADGLGFGGSLGYDFKLDDSIVLGLEASIGGTTGKLTDGAAPGVSIKAGRTLGVTGRLGFLAAPETLVYAKGGYVNGRFSFRDSGDNVSTNKDGWTLGAGVEQSLTPNISARLEYAYSKFGRFGESGADIGLDQISARFTRNEIKAGVNFRF